MARQTKDLISLGKTKLPDGVTLKHMKRTVKGDRGVHEIIQVEPNGEGLNNFLKLYDSLTGEEGAGIGFVVAAANQAIATGICQDSRLPEGDLPEGYLSTVLPPAPGVTYVNPDEAFQEAFASEMKRLGRAPTPEEFAALRKKHGLA